MEAPQPQPDFLIMAADMNTIATDMHRVTSIATNIEKMQNISAFNQGEAILQAINELSLRIDNRFDSM